MRMPNVVVETSKQIWNSKAVHNFWHVFTHWAEQIHTTSDDSLTKTINDIANILVRLRLESKKFSQHKIIQWFQV